MKKFAIITASDEKYGYFLINHWLKSLLEHVDKKSVQIIVLDYGLTDLQRKQLKTKNVRVEKCLRNGHVVNIRFRDILRILRKDKYEQILSVDSGDILFQKSIMEIFSQKGFRAVVEDLDSPMIDQILATRSVSVEIEKQLPKLLEGRRMINGGVVIADYSHFIELCLAMNKNILDKNRFGADQAVLNYVFYKKGFIALDRTFNYVIGTVRDNFKVKEGVFYDGNGRVISVVHNAGGNGKSDFYRIVKNFGYGRECNQISSLKKISVRNINRLAFILKPFFKLFRRFFN